MLLKQNCSARGSARMRNAPVSNARVHIRVRTHVVDLPSWAHFKILPRCKNLELRRNFADTDHARIVGRGSGLRSHRGR